MQAGDNAAEAALVQVAMANSFRPRTKNFAMLLAALLDDIGNRNGHSVYDQALQTRWFKLGKQHE